MSGYFRRPLRRTLITVALTVWLALSVALAGGLAERARAADGAWVKQSSGTTMYLSAVYFVNETTGWAVGDNATVLHTANGGATWEAQSVPVSSGTALKGVDFVDPLNGWIAESLKVLYTNNGGQTWASVAIPNVFSGALNDVDFVDADRGLTGGLWINSSITKNYSLSISGNGGTGWSNIDFGASGIGQPTIEDIEWADALNAWACGDTAVSTLALIHSSDGGASWAKVGTGVGAGTDEPSGGFAELDFVDATHGWAVSGFVVDSAAGNGPVMLYTSDGGASWQHRHWAELGLAAADRPSAIDFVDQLHGWMVGGGSTWHSADGGLTWQSVALPEYASLKDVDFVTDSCGWAVDGSGKIYHYTGTAAPSDTTPPVTTASGSDAKWHNRAVTVTFTATDNAGGSGVDYTEYKTDSGPWIRGSQVTIPAPARGANDGVHTLSYRSADKAAPANLEAVKSCQVKIDTVGPLCKAKNVTVKRGKTCKLLFYVGDARSEQVTTVIRIKTLRGVTKKTFSWSYDDANRWWTAKYKANLKRGTYRYYVYGNDLAGNAQSVVGWAKLTVK